MASEEIKRRALKKKLSHLTNDDVDRCFAALYPLVEEILPYVIQERLKED